MNLITLTHATLKQPIDIVSDKIVYIVPSQMDGIGSLVQTVVSQEKNQVIPVVETREKIRALLTISQGEKTNV